MTAGRAVHGARACLPANPREPSRPTPRPPGGGRPAPARGPRCTTARTPGSPDGGHTHLHQAVALRVLLGVGQDEGPRPQQRVQEVDHDAAARASPAADAAPRRTGGEAGRSPGV